MEFFTSFRTTNSSDSNILDGIHIGQSSHNLCIELENTKNVLYNLFFFCIINNKYEY